MEMPNYNFNKGAALISVLLVVSLLTWVITYFIGKTTQQIELAKLQKERVMAEIQADSSVDQMLYAHFSKSYLSNDEYKEWNYRGTPFQIDKSTTVTLQDTQGKLSLINLNENLFTHFLLSNGFKHNEVNRIKDCLADWQDNDDLSRLNGEESEYYQTQNLPLPRNKRIQSMSELSLICGFPSEQSKQQLILNNLLLYSMGSFNPLFASKQLIKGVQLSPDRKRLLNDLVEEGNTALAQKYFGVADSSLSAMNMQLSNEIELSVKVTNGDAVAIRNIVFRQNIRYKPRPILQFWHWSE